MIEVNRHPIRVVARRTGTPESTLRAWERRYDAVSPDRAETGRRLYSDEEIERLRLIRRVVDAGRPISSVARLPDSELRRLIREDLGERVLTGSEIDKTERQAVVDACMRAIESMEPAALRSQLNRAVLKFPALTLIDEIIAPLLQRIGDFWYSNRFSPRHEHMASSVVRTILTQLQAGIQNTGPNTVVVATPPGQLHDLGTQFVSALSLAEGWTVVNLGANIAAGDIRATADEVGASVVALSVVLPAEDPVVEETFTYLGEHLGPKTKLVVGGKGAETYRNVIERANGVVMQSAQEFWRFLSRMDD